MNRWQIVWRRGLAPQFTTSGLRSFRQALNDDDSRLLRGATTSPPPLQCVGDWPVEAAGCIGYCGWKGEGLNSVAEGERFYLTASDAADCRLGERGSIRAFVDWFDDTPRDELRRLLL